MIVNVVPIKSKPDKVEFKVHHVNAIDNKIGKAEKAKNEWMPPNDKQPNGGIHWRQAVFYKLLVDNYLQKNWKVISAEFDFVEPNEKGVYVKPKIFISPADIETMASR